MMTRRSIVPAIVLVSTSLLFATGCPAKSSDDGSVPPAETPETPETPEMPETPETPVTPEAPERESLTSADCAAKGGEVVGDIGDGAIHRADYKCANGQPPMGTIKPADGEPIASEGSVCCGK